MTTEEYLRIFNNVLTNAKTKAEMFIDSGDLMDPPLTRKQMLIRTLEDAIVGIQAKCDD